MLLTLLSKLASSRAINQVSQQEYITIDVFAFVVCVIIIVVVNVVISLV